MGKMCLPVRPGIPPPPWLPFPSGEGSALMDAEGAEAKALSVTGDRNVVWLMDISAGTVFQLTAESGGSIYRITAEYDTDAGSVTVTANKE